jgi:hypothetical protein
MTKPKKRLEHLRIWISGLFRISDFVLRISGRERCGRPAERSARMAFVGAAFQPQSLRGKMPLPQKNTLL